MTALSAATPCASTTCPSGNAQTAQHHQPSALRTLAGTQLLAGRSLWQAVCSAHPGGAAPCGPPPEELSVWWQAAAGPPLHTFKVTESVLNAVVAFCVCYA
jgi:hypothetical protein